MIRLAFVNDLGRVTSIVLPGNSETYTEGAIAYGTTARYIPEGFDDVSHDTIISTWYWAKGKWEVSLPRSTSTEFWDPTVSSWVEDVALRKENATKDLGECVRNFILDTSGYNVLKQINALERQFKLNIKRLDLSISPEEQIELDTSDAIRDWKDNMILEHDRVAGEIEVCECGADIVSAVESFQWVSKP